MKSIVVEEQEQEQEQEEGSESERETGFVGLDQDTLHNVLKRVDMVTLGRAACVNKLWSKVAWDDWLWEPFIIRNLINSGKLEHIDKFRNMFRRKGFLLAFHRVILPQVAKPPPSDFYSIDLQVFSSQIGPWVQNKDKISFPSPISRN